MRILYVVQPRFEFCREFVFIASTAALGHSACISSFLSYHFSRMLTLSIQVFIRCICAFVIGKGLCILHCMAAMCAMRPGRTLDHLDNSCRGILRIPYTVLSETVLLEKDRLKALETSRPQKNHSLVFHASFKRLILYCIVLIFRKTSRRS